MTRCYDFPEAVVHDPNCPRYNGGVCRPMPTPVEPYTEEEASAVHGYTLFKEASFDEFVPIDASGSTLLPPQDARA